MPNTPNFGIFFPDGDSQMTPIQTVFASVSSSVDEALLELAGDTPQQANSAAARDAIFPSPQQGDTIYRTDRGWTERYFNIYNAATNPGGTLVAGWHSIDFKPSGAAVQPFSAASGWSVVSEHGRRFGPLAFVSVVLKRTGAKISVPNNGNLGNITVATVPSAWAAVSGPSFPMVATNSGRVLAGGLDNTTLFLSAMGNLYDIEVNDTLSFAGFYMLLNP